jgi:hypothetical protein
MHGIMADKIRERSAIIVCAMVCTALIICGILFWPTLYRYDKLGKFPVRINRITGYAEQLSTSGWWPIGYPKSEAIPTNEMEKIIYKTKNIGSGYFEAEVYNGSDWNITEIKVNILAKYRDGTIIWKRDYITYVKDISYIPPNKSGMIKAQLFDADNIPSFEYRIKEVMGWK